MVLAVVLLLAGAVVRSLAVELSLIAYVSNALLQDDEVSALPDGSYVAIFGSADNNNDGPAFIGSYMVPFAATGDDVFLGYVRINPYFSGAGTFISDQDFAWETTDVEINYLYIRFFNTTGFEIGVPVVWGVSDVFPASPPQFFVVEQDFIGGFVANMTNNVALIPEPTTANLMLLFGGLLVGLRASLKRRVKTEPAGNVSRKDGGV